VGLSRPYIEKIVLTPSTKCVRRDLDVLQDLPGPATNPTDTTGPLAG
jgi:hypothetical protein